LNILLSCNGALWMHEGETEASSCGALSHLWRESGGEV
jgi:hypothetical protein